MIFLWLYGAYCSIQMMMLYSGWMLHNHNNHFACNSTFWSFLNITIHQPCNPRSMLHNHAIKNFTWKGIACTIKPQKVLSSHQVWLYWSAFQMQQSLLKMLNCTQESVLNQASPKPYLYSCLIMDMLLLPILIIEVLWLPILIIKILMSPIRLINPRCNPAWGGSIF